LIWDVEAGLRSLEQLLRSSADDGSDGSSHDGFDDSIPGGVPKPARQTLQQLRKFDQFMDHIQHRQWDNSTTETVLAVRNGLHHRLLSMPRWLELSVEERQGSLFAPYEICRLTALIYSTAVLYPFSTASGWLQKLLDEIRQVVEMSNIQHWIENTTSLLTWALTITCIAAHRSVHRRFFRDALRNVLIVAGMHEWSAVKAILMRFLWTDSACGAGGIVVWESLDLEPDVRDTGG
jgi:hypothetical protein